jgi:hypothetical protein
VGQAVPPVYSIGTECRRKRRPMAYDWRFYISYLRGDDSWWDGFACHRWL